MNLLDDILEMYSEVFDSELGKMEDMLVKIPVPSETKPVFCKARPVPHAIKEKVENELECFIKKGMNLYNIQSGLHLLYQFEKLIHLWGLKKKKNFMAPFYGWGSTASRLEPLRGGSLLLPLSSQNSRYSFYQPRKDERLSRPWSHPVVLNTGPLDWESSALTARP